MLSLIHLYFNYVINRSKGGLGISWTKEPGSWRIHTVCHDSGWTVSMTLLDVGGLLRMGKNSRLVSAVCWYSVRTCCQKPTEQYKSYQCELQLQRKVYYWPIYNWPPVLFFLEVLGNIQLSVSEHHFNMPWYCAYKLGFKDRNVH